MVNNIIDLINSKAAQAPLWTELMHRREQRIPTTFDEAILLLENYVNLKHLKITSMVEPYSVVFEEKNQTTEPESLTPSMGPGTFETLPPPAIPVSSLPMPAYEPAGPINQPLSPPAPFSSLNTAPPTFTLPSREPLSINFANKTNEPVYHHTATPIPPPGQSEAPGSFVIPQFKFEPLPNLPSFSKTPPIPNTTL